MLHQRYLVLKGGVDEAAKTTALNHCFISYSIQRCILPCNYLLNRKIKTKKYNTKIQSVIRPFQKRLNFKQSGDCPKKQRICWF